MKGGIFCGRRGGGEGLPRWPGGYSHIVVIRVCAAGKSMVFKPFSLG